jgi:hypothetical protein
VQHGLIAATADQNSGYRIQWASGTNLTITVSDTSTDIGTGSANTTKIIAQNGPGTTYAAGLAQAYTSDGYSDWYLPSKDELYELYRSKDAIGGFETTTSPYYWSSSQSAGIAGSAWGQGFGDGLQGNYFKSGVLRVRAVRAF